jgi:hypothetical protein
LIKFTTPLTGRDYDNRPREVFLLTPDEYDKVNKIVENIREMIELHKKKISLFKDMVPAIMGKLTSK